MIGLKRLKILFLLLFCTILFFISKQISENPDVFFEMLSEELENTVAKVEENLPWPFSNGVKVQMDVPLENQFDAPSLQNGCEITALSMLLQYYGYNVNKNQLANQLNYVPLKVDNTHYGDPNEGFVGNIKEGNQAMGVWSAPIKAVAEQVVGHNYIVHNEALSFEQLKNLISQSTPVWILATLELKVPHEQDFRRWPTLNGVRKVTPKIHSVVITGINGRYFYVNDPFGYKNRRVKQTDLQQIFESLGNQAIYLEKK